MAKDKTSTNVEETSNNETPEQEVSVKPKGKKGRKIPKDKTLEGDAEIVISEFKSENSKKKTAIDQKSSEEESPDENGTEIENIKDKIIPLLDQPAVVEGPRSRKTIKVFDATIPVSKKLDIKIPDAKGVPLGLIRVVNLRLKRLDDIVIKELHRTLFGRTFGKTSALVNNLYQFRGFLFGKDSNEYKNKAHVLGTKFSLGELKQLLYVFNIDEMIKTKEEGIKLVLDFLLHPKRIKSVTKPAPLGHPRRKATKRNYFEVDFENVVRKKKKKHLPKDNDESPEKSTSKSKGKSKKIEETTENGENSVVSQKVEEETESDNNELKKPAKKRKRNQIIDEEEGVKEDDEPLKKSEFIGARGKRNGKIAPKKKSLSKISKNEEKISEATDLTDGELKEFLKGVLTDADLEQTTMKTIYGLIHDRYPNYDSSSKKEFIRDVVKSLVRTSE